MLDLFCGKTDVRASELPEKRGEIRIFPKRKGLNR